MEQNENIEKSANASLNDFLPKPGEEKPVEAKTEEQPAQTPAGVEAQPPVVEKNTPQMIDPSEIKLGKAVDGDGTKNKLDEDDVEEIEYGDKKLRVSKNYYTIKTISKQDDLAIKKISSGEFEKSRDGKTQWVQTRLEITYEGDRNYKTSLPNLKWFEARYTPKLYTPSFKKVSTEKEYQNKFTSMVSKLYYKFCVQFSREPGSFVIEEFFEGLIGKKVQLVEYQDEFDGKTFRRLDVWKFV